MTQLSKRQQLIAKELTQGKVYSVEQALELLKKVSKDRKSTRLNSSH